MKNSFRLISIILTMIFILGIPIALAEEAPESEGLTPVPDNALEIDTSRVYSGMDKSYSAGYIPRVVDNKVTIVLPLIGKTKNNEILVTPDIGTTGNEPFVYANYQFKVFENNGVYLISLEIPLISNRINGLYPVLFTVEYSGNSTGTVCSQNFTVYVTISDGLSPNAIETMLAPDLFLTGYTTSPDEINGGDEFTVSATIKNVGNQASKNIKLSYGGAGISMDTSGGGIRPTGGTGTIFIESIAAGKSQSIAFTMKSDVTAYAGMHQIPIAMEYTDGKGGVFSSLANLSVTIKQPVTVTYDKIAFPEFIESGDSTMLPVGIFNTGYATVYNVFWALESASLISASVYLGNIEPGMSNYGELKVFAATISAESPYGQTGGILRLTYSDIEGNKYSEEIMISTEILAPASEEALDDAETGMLQDPSKQSQWWVSMLVAVCIIAVITSVIIILRFNRALKIK